MFNQGIFIHIITYVIPTCNRTITPNNIDSPNTCFTVIIKLCIKKTPTYTEFSNAIREQHTIIDINVMSIPDQYSLIRRLLGSLSSHKPRNVSSAVYHTYAQYYLTID